MRFRLNQAPATPIKITIRDQGGNVSDLTSYTSVIADVISPAGVTHTVTASKTGSDVYVTLPALDEIGMWSLYVGFRKQQKIDYSERIDFDVE